MVLLNILSIPFISPSACFFNTAFTSSTVVSFSTSNTTSTIETVGTGTLIEIHLIFLLILEILMLLL